MKTKLFTLFAALCLAAFAPQNSAAQTWTGSGNSASDPYQISSVADLAQLATNVNGGNEYSDKFFRLTANLNLNVPPHNSGEGWTPIGNDFNRFEGNFDGDGKTISGLFIDRISTDYQGLFGVIDGGEVKNLGLENVNIKGKDFVGSMAGVVTNSSLTNCYATGDVSGNNYVGGVAGKVFSEVFIGSGVSRLTNCSATGNVSGTGNNVGGVAGEVVVDGGGVISLTNCYATGAVSGSNQVGGVAGGVTGSSLSNCYATGAVSGNNSVGGVAGVVYTDGSNLSNCAALNPSVKATGSPAGRVVGYNGGTLSNNIAWDGMGTDGGIQFSGANAHDGLGGASITTLDIHGNNGTLGGRFTNDDNPWTTANSRLPGFGTAVDMPAHLIIAPVAPSAVSATAGNGEVTLNWTAGGDGGSPITKYRIAYGTSQNPSNWQDIPGSDATTVTGLNNGTRYYFLVRAVNALGDGTASTEVSAVPVAPITSAAITIVEPATGNTPVTTAPTGGTGYSCSMVSWTPNNNPFVNNTAYTASVTLTAGAAYTFPTGFTAATINGQTAMVTNNTGGSVTLSYTFLNTVSNTGSPQTVIYAGSTIDLSGISGLFSVDANAGAKTYTIESVDGTAAGSIGAGTDNNKLTVTSCGTFTIGRTTAATGTHLAGAKVTATLTVNKATPTASQLTFTIPSHTYTGLAQGIGSVTAGSGVVGLGTVTVYYTGVSGTSYNKQTSPP
ncbi:MAG: fibronectin type III domain-containing protein, partial [Prevotellaceae bacterium]|nr:fibronectin type III domain-containing protein [Prevotellaceae bacterium]